MKKTFISITITYYGYHYIKPDVHYYRNVDDQRPYVSNNKLSVEDASKLMWELVKLGGKKFYESNTFQPSICSRTVDFYGVL